MTVKFPVALLWLIAACLAAACANADAAQLAGVHAEPSEAVAGQAVSIRIDFKGGRAGASCGLSVQFGDGETAKIKAEESAPVVLSHVYRQPGGYTVSAGGKTHYQGLMHSAAACDGVSQTATVVVHSPDESARQATVKPAARAAKAPVAPSRSLPHQPDAAEKRAIAEGRLSEGVIANYGGAYSTDCADPHAPRLRIAADAIVLERDGRSIAGQNVMSAFGYFGQQTPPHGFEVAMQADPQIENFLIFRDKTGLYLDTADLARVPQAAAIIAGDKRRFRICGGVASSVAAAPQSASVAATDSKYIDAGIVEYFRSDKDLFPGKIHEDRNQLRFHGDDAGDNDGGYISKLNDNSDNDGNLYGDLDGDGIPETIVTYHYQPEAVANAYDGTYVFSRKGGAWKLLTTTTAFIDHPDDGIVAKNKNDICGDIHPLKIENGSLVASMNCMAPNDPLCCPSLNYTVYLRLQGNRLVLVKKTRQK